MSEPKKRGRPSTKEKVVKALTKAELSREYLKERTGKEALADNKVLLWGLHRLSRKLVEKAEEDYKPPAQFKLSKTVQPDRDSHKQSGEKSKEAKTAKKKEVRVFVRGEDYGVEDLPFLEAESDRIDDIIDNGKYTADEEDKLLDDQEAIYDLIEGLKALKKMKGGMIRQVKQDDLESDIDGESDYDDDQGSGLLLSKSSTGLKTKGKGLDISKLKKRELKTQGGAVKQEKKARMVKGSPEAKEWGKRLAEAKKAKALAAGKVPKEKPAPKEKKPKGLPYYYIGEVPKGYREATQEEAIINNMVAFWGKHKVDELKYRTYNVLGTMFNETPDLKTLGASIMGMRRRIQRLLKDEEIYKTKLQADKHKEKWGQYKVDLLETEEQLKYAKIMLEHYLKLYALDKGVPYVKPEYKIEGQYIPKAPEKKEDGYSPKSRTTTLSGEFELPEELKDIPKIKKEEPKKPQRKKYMFTAEGQENLILNNTHFDKDFNLTSKTAKTLFDKNIRLDPEFYNKEDKERYFYSKHSNLSGGALSWRTLFKPVGGVYKDMMETTQGLEEEFNGLPLSVQRLIRDLGDKKIDRLIINRNPVQSAVTGLLNGLSFGQFKKNTEDLGYDKLFHLQIQGYAGGKPFMIEKNEILNADTKINPPPQSEQKEVKSIPNITVREAIRNCKKYLGVKFTTYSAQYNNCQDFALAFLKASNIGDQSDYDFVKQNTEELFNKMGIVSKTADSVVGTYAGLKDKLGYGINSKSNDLSLIPSGEGLGKVENHNVQSILFGKKYFTLKTAKKWLKDHQFKQEVDEKPKHFRFRQFSPSKSDNYITKHITTGIEFILKIPHYIEHI